MIWVEKAPENSREDLCRDRHHGKCWWCQGCQLGVLLRALLIVPAQSVTYSYVRELLIIELRSFQRITQTSLILVVGRGLFPRITLSATTRYSYLVLHTVLPEAKLTSSSHNLFCKQQSLSNDLFFWSLSMRLLAFSRHQTEHNLYQSNRLVISNLLLNSVHSYDYYKWSY